MKNITGDELVPELPPYRLVRSARRTMSIEITAEGEVLVRAPHGMSDAGIQAVLIRKQAWIQKHLANFKERPPKKEYTAEEISALKARAAAVLPDKVAHYAKIMGYTPPKIRITAAKTRFGSCSPRNTLCFSCFLMLYPQEAIDYVVVHELAHITEKNHGPAFYAIVRAVMPDYKARRALLKQPPAAI
jgi:predicted metal-dependent hydrolase